MAIIRLLLVDDEERFLTTTSALLEKRGLETFTATNGLDAIKVLDANRIDVVILDVRMPGLDGLEVLCSIKHKHPLIEVIMLTGHATVESAVSGLRLGAFDYLMKPCDVSVLLKKVAEAHARKQTAEEEARKARIDHIVSDPLSVFEDEQPPQ